MRLFSDFISTVGDAFIAASEEREAAKTELSKIEAQIKEYNYKYGYRFGSVQIVSSREMEDKAQAQAIVRESNKRAELRFDGYYSAHNYLRKNGFEKLSSASLDYYKGTEIATISDYGKDTKVTFQ